MCLFETDVTGAGVGNTNMTPAAATRPKKEISIWRWGTQGIKALGRLHLSRSRFYCSHFLSRIFQLIWIRKCWDKMILERPARTCPSWRQLWIRQLKGRIAPQRKSGKLRCKVFASLQPTRRTEAKMIKLHCGAHMPCFMLLSLYVCKTDRWRPSQCIQNILIKCWSGATCRQRWKRGNTAWGTLLDSWLRSRGPGGIWRFWPGSCHGLLRGNVTNVGSAWAATGSDSHKTACGFTSILLWPRTDRRWPRLTAGQTCMVPVTAAPADRGDETGLITATAPMTALLDYRVLD